MTDDPFTWLDRNKAAISAYEKGRKQRETVRLVLAGILTLAGIGILASLLL